MHRFLTPLLATALCVAATPALLDLTLEPDEDNVTAGRLAGTWEADPVVGERLGTARSEDSEDPAPAARYRFDEDPSVLDALPDKYEQFLGSRQIFEAGTMTHTAAGEVRVSAPYVLITHAGNPHVMYFRARGDDPLGDAESFNLFVAAGKESSQDLLLVGGDFDNQPFRAFRRVAE